jgi:hypothetical protein
MANEKKRGSRETKKPKKPVPKTNAAAPSIKGTVTGAMKIAGRGLRLWSTPASGRHGRP